MRSIPETLHLTVAQRCWRHLPTHTLHYCYSASHTRKLAMRNLWLEIFCTLHFAQRYLVVLIHSLCSWAHAIMKRKTKEEKKNQTEKAFEHLSQQTSKSHGCYLTLSTDCESKQSRLETERRLVPVEFFLTIEK